MQLAYLTGSDVYIFGETLSDNHYRHITKWLLGSFASETPIVEDRLLEMARTLDRHCIKE